jgi:hypothetical protein
VCVEVVDELLERVHGVCPPEAVTLSAPLGAE